MTGARTFPVRLTVAQWDTLLAAVDRAAEEWLAQAEGASPVVSRAFKTQAQTLARSRAALVEAWTDGSRMVNP